MLLLFAILAINLFLLWLVTDPFHGISSAAYRQMEKSLAGQSMEERQAFLQQELYRVQALVTIDAIVQSEASLGGKTDTSGRAEYADLFTSYGALYQSGAYLLYCDTLRTEFQFVQKIAAECDTVYRYPSFLSDIAQKAEQLSEISIFAQSTDGYSLKNITATAAAYAGMEHIPIQYEPQMGLYTALDFALTDLMTVFLMLLLAIQFVRIERDNGMLFLIRATSAGRLKTAIAKLLALFLSLGAILLLLYGSNLLYCGILYSLGDLGRSIQSVPALMKSPLQVTVGQYLLLFFVTKWAAAVVAGTWIMAAMLLARHAVHGTLGALALFGANLLVRSIVPAASRWNVLKYANLISLLRTNEWLGSYRNLYWFGSPIEIIRIESITAIGAFALFAGLFCRLFASGHLQSGTRISLPAFSRKPRPTTVQRTEWHKLLFVNGALLFCVLFAGYQLYQASAIRYYMDSGEIYYRYYMQQAEGPVTQQTLESLYADIDEFLPLRQASEAYLSKEITADKYQILMQTNASLQQKYQIWQMVFQQAKDIADNYAEYPRAQLVYETGYYKLFDLNDQYDTADALLTLLVCVLCFSGLFAMEKQTGMLHVIAATPKGRLVTVRCKLRCADQLCIVLALLSVLPRFWAVMRDYGLGAIWAPIYSLPAFRDLPELPIAFFLLLFLGARWLAIRLAAGITLVLSQKTGNLFAAMISAAVILCLPLLFSVSGLTDAKWFSLFYAFHAVAFLQNSIESITLIMLAVLYSTGIFICNEILEEFFYKALSCR